MYRWTSSQDKTEHRGGTSFRPGHQTKPGTVPRFIPCKILDYFKIIAENGTRNRPLPFLLRAKCSALFFCYAACSIPCLPDYFFQSPVIDGLIRQDYCLFLFPRGCHFFYIKAFPDGFLNMRFAHPAHHTIDLNNSFHLVTPLRLPHLPFCSAAGSSVGVCAHLLQPAHDPQQPLQPSQPPLLWLLYISLALIHTRLNTRRIAIVFPVKAAIMFPPRNTLYINHPL